MFSNASKLGIVNKHLQTTKMQQKMSLIFLYSYNTLILLTNKIFVKKTKQFLKNTQKNGLINKKKKGINRYSPIIFCLLIFFTIILIFYLLKE